MTGSPYKCKVDTSDEAIEDLKSRLASARWPDQLEDGGWEYGAELEYMKGLAEYWRTDFSWRKQEALLNQYDQFKLEVNGINLHFLHARSSNPEAIPLLFVHGWPGSYYEVYKLVPLLLDNYHVIAPSLPGFGFSSAPRKKGFDCKEMAKTMNELMVALGYSTYVAQGGDWGGIIVKILGALYHDNCRAVHTNFPIAMPQMWNPWHIGLYANSRLPVLKSFPLFGSEREIKGLQDLAHFMEEETGYSKEQGTKPQTLGYAMTDSPLGLLAWITEKFRTWTDCNGNLESVLTKDELLTNISIYWFSGSITSSFRIYYENQHAKERAMALYCKVPTAAAIFPKELMRLPRSFIAAGYNLKQWSEFEKGGHFAAMEVPDALAADMTRFFAKWH